MKKLLIILCVAFTSLFASAQKSHFGMLLGAAYDLEEVSNSLVLYYGNRCHCMSSGKHYSAIIYEDTQIKNGTFKRCTIYFYNNYFWKIVYEDIKTDAQSFANNLEWEYSDYSISDTDYEYKFGDVEVKFDGEDLRYVSNKVTRSMYNSIRGGYF